MKVNICLFDDSLQVTESLTTLFNLVEGFSVVAAFSNANNSLDKIANTNANLVIMDIDMPIKDGF